MDSIGDESIDAHEHWFKKYGAEGLIASSVDLGWLGLSAALRTHGRGMIEYQGALSQAEICVAICQRSFKAPLVAEIAFAIVSEMRTQTAGGRLLAETLAVSLAARLVHSHSGLSPDKDLEQ